MPSIFERVGRSLTRKKPEVVTQSRESVGTTLEGFEPLSPSDAQGYVPPTSKSPTQEKSQGVFQALMRSKSPSRNTPKIFERAPHLSLHLPELSKNGITPREKFGLVFYEAPDPKFSDEILAAKRLSTPETLQLVKKTSTALLKKGQIRNLLRNRLVC